MEGAGETQSQRESAEWLLSSTETALDTEAPITAGQRLPGGTGTRSGEQWAHWKPFLRLRCREGAGFGGRTGLGGGLDSGRRLDLEEDRTRGRTGLRGGDWTQGRGLGSGVGWVASLVCGVTVQWDRAGFLGRVERGEESVDRHPGTRVCEAGEGRRVSRSRCRGQRTIRVPRALRRSALVPSSPGLLER